MQMEHFLGNPNKPKNDSIWDAPLQLNLGRWKRALCLKIGYNEVSTNASLPLYYDQHSSMPSRNLILEKSIRRWNRKRTSLHKLKNVMNLKVLG